MAQLHAQFGESITQLSQDEIHTMVYAFQQGQISNEDLQSKLITHRVDIGKMLRGLVDKGLLVSHGYGRAMHYMIPNLSSYQNSNEILENNLDTNADILDITVPNLDISAPNLDISDLLSEKLKEEIQLYKLKQRHDLQVTEAIIVKICSEKELKLNEIALILNKKPVSIKRPILHLLKQDKLKLKYPDKPTHRQQAYYAKRS